MVKHPLRVICRFFLLLSWELYQIFEIVTYFVGNKVKGRISERVFQENKARQVFWKTNIFYPLIRKRTCVYQRVKNVRFSENLTCFVFLKHPFEIRLSALLPTISLWHPGKHRHQRSENTAKATHINDRFRWKIYSEYYVGMPWCKHTFSTRRCRKWRYNSAWN